MASYTERYIAAAMRTVPEDNRADVRAELQASIDDAVEARSASGEDHDAAERAVLTGFGDPDRLAAGYADRRLYLIGPEVFLDWWRLLRLLLWFVLPIATIGIVLGQALSGAKGGELIAAAVTAILTVGVHLVFWTTLMFVILERTDARPQSAAWSVEQLRDVRPPGSVALTDLVGPLVFIAFMVGAVVWDRYVGFVQVEGRGVPLLDPALWPAWIGVLLAVLVAEIVFVIMLYRNQWWTPVFAVANAVLAVAAAVVGLVLLATGALLNAALFDVVAAGDPAAARQVVTIATGVAFVAIAAWDIADGVIKTVRQGRR